MCFNPLAVQTVLILSARPAPQPSDSPREGVFPFFNYELTPITYRLTYITDSAMPQSQFASASTNHDLQFLELWGNAYNLPSVETLAVRLGMRLDEGMCKHLY
jgi:hypothetical protein